MKKSLLLVAALAVLAVSCNKEDKKQEAKIFDTITYGGAEYRTITLGNGQTWMVDPLCIVPEGMSVSDDPATSKDICYPYEFSLKKAAAEKTDTTWFTHKEDKTNVKDSINYVKFNAASFVAELKVVKDEAKIRKQGLLYSWKTIFGVDIDESNYTQFEGAQGICPDGWHVPTCAEWKALVGVITGDADKNTSALFYDEVYDGGNLATMNASNWLFTPAGTVAAGKYTTTFISPAHSTYEKYETVSINDPKCGKARKLEQGVGAKASEWEGLPIMTYIASSTGKSKTQMYAAMTAFGASSIVRTPGVPDSATPMGKISGAYANIANACVTVRCIRDAK